MSYTLSALPKKFGGGESSISNQCAYAFDNACALQPEASRQLRWLLNCSVEEGHPPSKEEDTKVSNKPKVPEKTRAPTDEPKVPEKTRAPTEQAKQPPPVSNLAPPDPVGSTEPARVPSEPSLGQLGVESLVVPEFKSPKEKECWELYRRMCDKGVTVSYDTVLRGMLTPTEYRLRRNALLSTC
uniref:(California timema) hypothetical protein n=1 Tax=Timema californicum TaxID=61474 RepID=A0A7R9JGW5_TIMCA|nr:unnamed protein product [Timema californicum]